jgi:hypothetical protein
MTKLFFFQKEGLLHNIFICDARENSSNNVLFTSEVTLVAQRMRVLTHYHDMIDPYLSSRFREKEDLTWCLKQLRHSCPQARHILILEDDAVIKDDFFTRLRFLLELIERQHYGAATWLDLKLYSQPRLQGFAWDAQPLIELIAYSAIFGWIMEVLCSLVLCRRFGR